MNGNDMIRNIMEYTPGGLRSIAQTKLKCLDRVVRTWANLQLKPVGWPLGIGNHGGRSWRKRWHQQNCSIEYNDADVFIHAMNLYAASLAELSRCLTNQEIAGSISGISTILKVD